MNRSKRDSLILSKIMGLPVLLYVIAIGSLFAAATTGFPSDSFQDEEAGDFPENPIQSIDGLVNGTHGGLANATVLVVFSESTEEPPLAANLDPGRVLDRATYTTDESGRYQIVIPDQLIGHPRLRLSLEVKHEGYLGRHLGPVPVSDFRGQAIESNEPFWLHRQLTRSAIKHTRLKKGRLITGTVVGEDGTPIERATVVMRSKYRPYSWKFHDPDDYSMTAETQTNMIGEFTILADESSTLTIVAEGRAPLVIDDLAKYDSPVTTDGPNTFRLPTSVRLSGRLMKHDGTPLSFAVIRINRHIVWDEFDMPLAFGRSCVTDEEGRYSLPPLPPGSFTFAVNSALANRDDAVEVNRNGRFNSHISHPTVPISDVFLPQLVELSHTTVEPTLDLTAVETQTITVTIEIDPEMAPRNRAPKIPIRGTLNGERWSGVSIDSEANPKARFYVPTGIEDVVIEPGTVSARTSPDEAFRIMDAIHLGRVTDDVEGVTIRLAPRPKH